ncbi:MAG: cytochrome b [Bosea sp. (in: a-proteobacteria)]
MNEGRPEARQPSASYAPAQKWLHWIIAFLVLLMIPVGKIMSWRKDADNFDALTNQLYSGHKLFGFIVLWLMAARIAFKLGRGAPPPVATLTPMERRASAAVHHLLYMLLFLVPLFGWAGVSAYGAREVFGMFSLPEIIPVNQSLAKILLSVHGALAMVLVALVLAHIGAAMMHGVIKRDGVMNRMIGWWPLKKL